MSQADDNLCGEHENSGKNRSERHFPKRHRAGDPQVKDGGLEGVLSVTPQQTANKPLPRDSGLVSEVNNGLVPF